MTDQNQQLTTDPDGRIDRRSLLTKAAAAGAVAWSVPLLMSEPAFAGNGVCTPSCAPKSFTPVLRGVDVCAADFTKIPEYNNANDPLKAFINNSVKLNILSVQAPASVTCPCLIGTVTTILSGLTRQSVFYKVGPETNEAGLAGECAKEIKGQPDLEVFPLNGYTIGNVVPAGYTNLNSFAIRKPGSVPDGTFRSNDQLCVAAGCEDKVGGDVVSRKCKFTLCFSSSPAGACSAVKPVFAIFTPVANSCSVGCGSDC